MHKHIHNSEKVIHWLLFLSFLGLGATALAADVFFSKEAIMDSFQKSLPLLGIEIAPADQLFIARIARRDTWDIHFYFGAIFGSLLFLWGVISIYRNRLGNVVYKAFFLGSGIILTTTGVMLFLRLYYPLHDKTFAILKTIHHYGYFIFIAMLILHIAFIVYNKSNRVPLMLQFNSKIHLLIFIVIFSLQSSLVQADEKETDFTRWSTDTNYLDGVMYLEGEKGAEILRLELSNCPYDKCKNADINKTDFGVKTIEVKKPDYRKAIQLLSISSAKGNPLASDKLLIFLLKRIDYKARTPNDYLVNLLYKDTGLTIEQYRKIIIRTIQDGLDTKKACFSAYSAGEFYEKEYLGFQHSTKDALKYYKEASEICPSESFYKQIASARYLGEVAKHE